ncbi:MAG: hypothetical protein JSR60_12610 [Proteobacteria bacterium]|nr:hypothetical protein [Pseudomonadota bacterium]
MTLRLAAVAMLALLLLPSDVSSGPAVSDAFGTFEPPMVWAHRHSCYSPAHRREDRRGPTWSYRDPRSGIDYVVTPDRMHVKAIAPGGRVLWLRKPHAGLPDYRVAPACIARIGVDRPLPTGVKIKLTRARGGSWIFGEGISGHYISLTFDNSQFGYLDAKTGKFIFVGQN